MSKRKRPSPWRARLAPLLALLLVAGGSLSCRSPYPEYVLPPERVGPLAAPVVTREVTRVVARVITATPPPRRPASLNRPLVMLLAPEAAPDAATLALAQRLAAMLDRRIGQEVRVVTPGDYAESIDALCANQADVAWLATPAYLLAAQRCGVEATWTVLRQDLPHHRGAWMVQSEAARRDEDLEPIRSLADLEGRSVAFTAPDSSTGYLFPRAMLAREGITPGEEVLVGGDIQAVFAVYRGEVDAAAVFWAPPGDDGRPGDARVLLAHILSDMTERVEVLALTERVPNDPLVMRGNLAPELRDALLVGLFDVARSAEGRELLDELYAISGLAPIDDAAYDGVREMIRLLGIDAQDLLDGRVMPVPAGPGAAGDE
jgi:phosphonate transport system substrate-binding protein